MKKDTTPPIVSEIITIDKSLLWQNLLQVDLSDVNAFEQAINKSSLTLTDEKYIPIQARQDEDDHWYLIPNELEKDFDTLNGYERYLDEFEVVFNKYRTGGNINTEQLYILQ